MLSTLMMDSLVLPLLVAQSLPSRIDDAGSCMVRIFAYGCCIIFTVDGAPEPCVEWGVVVAVVVWNLALE
jgi:hypothetical protein